MNEEDFDPDDETQPYAQMAAPKQAREIAPGLVDDDFAPSRTGGFLHHGSTLGTTIRVDKLDPLAEEVKLETVRAMLSLNQPLPAFETWDKDAAARERSAAVVKDLGARDDTLTILNDKLFAPVHIQGGPCVESAPEDEVFVSIDASFRVTCRACLVWRALLEGEAPPEGAPDPMAEKLYLGKWRLQLVAKLRKLGPAALVAFCRDQGLSIMTPFVPAASTDYEALRKWLIDQALAGALDHGCVFPTQADGATFASMAPASRADHVHQGVVLPPAAVPVTGRWKS